jgi:hypothetical protein
MKRFFMLVLITGLVVGGYSCNSSTEKTSDTLGIEESESPLDPMEQELFEEDKQYEQQNDLQQNWGEAEDAIPEEDLGD